jgi:DNA polymerase III epsilon subunit-like protein
MFTPTGLFKEIPCPRTEECQLLNCIFSHEQVKFPEFEASQDDEPAPKKRRLDRADLKNKQRRTVSVSDGIPSKAISKPPRERDSDTTRNSKIATLPRKEISPPPLGKLPKLQKTSFKPEGPNAEAASADAPAQRSSALSNKSKETLNPRTLSKPPATHAIRLTILKMLHEAMVKLNNEAAKENENNKNSLVLLPDELITMALDEEEQAAKNNTSVYSNVIKLRIAKIKKMTIEEWKADVLKKFEEKYFPVVPKPKIVIKEIKTGLSKELEIAMLSHLVTPLKGLEKYGYVTSAPTQREIGQAREGVLAAEGYETCDRCGSRFQVFPGRRESDGALTSGGSCTYHSGKPIYSGKNQTYYSCCNQGIGESTGCTKGESHVFKVSEVKRLAAVLQFETTPAGPDEGARSPVCFDCEMGYTTLGLELIRLTAITWPGGEEIIDVLVRPMGEILDLNSKYSGVFPKHFAQAKPYDGSKSDEASNDVKDSPKKQLQIVESPSAARTLLFSFLYPETPLIGHAIDNDLNVCRIIHPTIIDTVLLYPHPKGLPIRFGLKVLAKKHLERNIQMGGDQGHDSKEDALATGDLVRVKVGAKWEQMKRQGWTVGDDTLCPPVPLEEPPNKRRGILGPGEARAKRTED